MSADRAYDAYRATRFFASLDGLRAICIALVLWHHSPAFQQMAEPIRLLTRGFTGVDFFFVLSGFLITTLLLREEAAKGRFSLRGFYRRRILRIVPVYFLVITLVGGWFVLVKGQAEYASIWPYYYLFLANFLVTDIPNLAPTWSLSVEEQYYMIWPLFLLLFPMRTGLRMGAVVAVLVYTLLALEGLLPLPGRIKTDEAWITIPIGSFAPILIGALTAMILHSRRGFAALWPVLGRRWFAPLGFLVLILLWQVLPETLLGWPGYAMHLTMAAILAGLVARPDHHASPVLTFAPLARIGAISYGLYLWHLIGRHFAVEALAVVQSEPVSWAFGATLLYLALSIAIAEISFRYFESYFLRLKTPRAQRPRPVVVRREGPPGDQAG